MPWESIIFFDIQWLYTIFNDIQRSPTIFDYRQWDSVIFQDVPRRSNIYIYIYIYIYITILKPLYVMMSLFPRYYTIVTLLNPSSSISSLPHTHQPPVQNRKHVLPWSNWSAYSLRIVLGHQDGQKELRGPSVRILWISSCGKVNLAAYTEYDILLPIY